MIKLISVDLFETLVDLSGNRHVLWRKFLGEGASSAKIEAAWQDTGRLLYQELDRINSTLDFKPLSSIFQTCLLQVFEDFRIAFDPEKAAKMVMDYHAERPWFPEALPWLNTTRNHYPICLSSDTDHAMMGAPVREYPFDRFFISQELGFYKGDGENRFFKTIIHHYGLHPHEILHVGDSPAEMEAARRMGLRTCWINRNNGAWPNDRMPDDTVLSLDQLDGIVPLHT